MGEGQRNQVELRCRCLSSGMIVDKRVRLVGSYCRVSFSDASEHRFCACAMLCCPQWIERVDKVDGPEYTVLRRYIAEQVA